MSRATDTRSATGEAAATPVGSVGPAAPEMLFRLDDMVAVVTGAARGIGLAAAIGLANHGATVVMCDVEEAELLASASSLAASGATTVPIIGDVTNPDDVDRVVAAATEAGGASVALNAAGIIRRHDIDQLTGEDLEALWAVNVGGTVAVTQSLLPQMRARGYGKVINVGSLGSVIGLERRTAYATTKGAVAQYTVSLAAEVGRYGIRANVVAPGYVATSMTSPYIYGDPTRTEKLLARIPLGRFADPTDLQGAFVFLASPASDYVTGQVLLVDGGWTAA